MRESASWSRMTEPWRSPEADIRELEAAASCRVDPRPVPASCFRAACFRAACCRGGRIGRGSGRRAGALLGKGSSGSSQQVSQKWPPALREPVACRKPERTKRWPIKASLFRAPSAEVDTGSAEEGVSREHLGAVPIAARSGTARGWRIPVARRPGSMCRRPERAVRRWRRDRAGQAAL